MGKIVKYCAACDESFAEKFAFCPNCGKGMQAFEMNPLAAASDFVEKQSVAPSNGNGVKAETPVQNFTEVKINTEPETVPVTADLSPIDAAQTDFTKIETPSIEVKPEIVEKPKAPVKESKIFAVPAAASGNGNGHKAQASNDGYRTVESQSYGRADNGFHITVIEEQNVKQRNALLLGSLLFMMALATGGLIYSLFNYNLSIAAIGDESGLAMAVIDDVPMEVEDEAPKPKNDKDAGGGGGGGRNEPTPTSQGKLANQTEKPLIAPDKSIVQKDNFELKQPIASTQGNKTFPPSDKPYGDPNSKYTLSSNGMGSGGGQGSGVGTGQGSGRGTGAGSGIGSGFGAGEGDGNGNGRGTGNQGIAGPPPPPVAKPKVPAVTIARQIIAKPRAEYTDAARQNNVTGTVVVKVTFLANGQIGSVVPVSSLPYGLTEKAIAAAKAIKFEPAKKDGVPYTTIAPVQYNFNIY